jgi:hypothetical protein
MKFFEIKKVSGKKFIAWLGINLKETFLYHYIAN